MNNIFATIINQIQAGNESYLLLWSIVTLLLTNNLLDTITNNVVYTTKLIDNDKNAIHIIFRIITIIVLFCFMIFVAINCFIFSSIFLTLMFQP